MKKMKRLFWLPVLLLAMLVTSCLKDDLNQGTIVLLGTESEVKPIDSLIPDTLLNFVQGMTPALNLPEGNTPPDIQGEYIFGLRELYKNNGHAPVANDTLYLRFGGNMVLDSVGHSYHANDILIQGTDTVVLQNDTTIYNTFTYYPNGQHNRTVPCEIYGDIPEKDNNYKLKKADAFVMGYVSGDGTEKSFTVYFTLDYDCDYIDDVSSLPVAEYTLTRGYVITGKITDGGIVKAVVACVNKDAKLTSDATLVPPDAIESMKNRIYIYRVKGSIAEPFGLAIRQQWDKP